jgi:peptidoglycan/LPS O-acetylase OafA/YrhL
MASFTFTIYLTHLPLMKFFVALGGGAIESMFWPTTMTLAAVVAIGLVTERRIGPWRVGFAGLVRLGDRIAGNAPLGNKITAEPLAKSRGRRDFFANSYGFRETPASA